MFDPVIVRGESMRDTFVSGSLVLAQKTGVIARGDIVRCRFPDREGTYIKRLIGLPGETLTCVGGTVYADGVPLTEPYVTSLTEPFEVTLGEDEYFVLGDNRAESYDSRETDMGAIRREDILGRVVWTVLPIDRCGSEYNELQYGEGRSYTMSEENKQEITQETEEETQQAEVQEQPAKPSLKKRFWKEVREWVVSLAVALAVVLVLRSFVFSIIRVDGSSMYPTLQDNERLFVTVYDVRFAKAERGDIVICHYPNRTTKMFGFLTVQTDFVKRVVGVPGDTVERKNGVTTITYPDGTQDVLDAGNTIYRTDPDYDAYTLGEDEYFVVGDNRNNSHDSRDWNDDDSSRDVGPITGDMIVGHVRYVFWPLGNARSVGTYEPSGVE